MPSAIREAYFNFFNQNEVTYPASGHPSKPALGSLSPGCRTCIEGTWSCLYITGACTRNCFFCPSPQSNENRDRQPVVPENVSFASAHDYVEYLKQFDFRGISFSGGEPLLVMGRVLDYMKAIKRCFGDRHYIWVYTNGDLVTNETLLLLKKAGLNELRFDIAANGYDLGAIKKAVDYIDTVSVEIPAIPEDVELVKPLLKEMENIGVKHLNLHQLMRTSHNSEHMKRRGYSPVNEALYPCQTPILESELAALELMKHAVDTKINLGINYCSRCYKAKFQGMANRKRAALFSSGNLSDVSGIGYLRKMAIDASTEEAAVIKSRVGETGWEITAEGETLKLIFSLEHFDALLTQHYRRADVIYYEPILTLANGNASAGVSPPEATGGNGLCVYKNVKFRVTLENVTSAFLFYKLFVERSAVETVAREVLDAYGLSEDDGGEILYDINEFYENYQEVEYLSKTLDPYD
jgi:pyruvate formate-lyase activating enzyme-like uncharacterized protein